MAKACGSMYSTTAVKLLPDQAFRQHPPLVRSLVLRRPPTVSHACVHRNTTGHSEPEPHRRNSVIQHFQENALIPNTSIVYPESLLYLCRRANDADLGQTGHTAHSTQPDAVLPIGEPDMPRKIASHYGRSGRSGGSWVKLRSIP